MSLHDYIAIARPSHWFKNIFIAPGLLLGFYFCADQIPPTYLRAVLLGLAAVCLVASSNYVLNEILDAPGDAHHPDKRNRPIPSGRVSIPVAYVEWIVLAALGLALAASVNRGLFLANLALWIMGLIYNVPPVRAKDLPYLDVLSESVNNPIRMAIGWYSLGITVPPTLSVLLAYWMFGAFLMAIKRFAEYRHIDDPARAGAYRKSFRYYNEERLLVSILFYIALFGMFSGVFISRYRMELVLAIPFVGFAIASYFRLGFKAKSPAMTPEEVWHFPGVFVPVGLAFLVCSVLLFVDFGDLSVLFSPAFPPRALP